MQEKIKDDTISRQAAIDLFPNDDLEWDTKGGYIAPHLARKMVEKLPSAEPQWIPCSERLPEKSGKYYVSGGDKVWICEFLIIPNFTGGWCNDASNPVVQAWMPLPEPYQEGKHE